MDNFFRSASLGVRVRTFDSTVLQSFHLEGLTPTVSEDQGGTFILDRAVTVALAGQVVRVST